MRTGSQHLVDVDILRFDQAFVAGLTATAFVLQAWHADFARTANPWMEPII